MATQRIKATKTASLTDLRNPKPIIESLADGQVAILDRNKVVAYLKHPSQEDTSTAYYKEGSVKKAFAQRKQDIQPVLEYLKDK
tara:strand:+ start:187 stop:438 length:252 start_codon:yes stop_codon:yes gene_type:complete